MENFHRTPLGDAHHIKDVSTGLPKWAIIPILFGTLAKNLLSFWPTTFQLSVFSNGFQHPEQKSKDMGSQVV